MDGKARRRDWFRVSVGYASVYTGGCVWGYPAQISLAARTRSIRAEQGSANADYSRCCCCIRSHGWSSHSLREARVRQKASPNDISGNLVIVP